MAVLPVIIFFGLGLAGCEAARGDHLSQFCYSCKHQIDPSHCQTTEKCWPGGYCGVEVKNVEGRNEFHLGCYDTKDCGTSLNLIGKRARGHHDPIICQQCCSGANCNKNLCSQFIESHQTTVSTAIGGSTLTGTGTCRDHDEDGFSCDVFDKQKICTDTDPLSSTYYLGHSKCPKYCGFCSDLVVASTILIDPIVVTSTAAPIVVTSNDPIVASSAIPIVASSSDPVVVASTFTSMVGSSANLLSTTSDSLTVSSGCFDIEQNGFLCANFDMFHFCTDTTSFAYPLANEKCRKHCGFCSTDTASYSVA